MKTIETAKDKKDEQAAEAFIAGIDSSRKADDRRRAADIAVRFEDYARTGTLRTPLELNHLKDGIWEIKAGDVRLPFYNAPAAADHSNLIRLTHGFLKKDQKCPPRHIRRAIAIRREDQER